MKVILGKGVLFSNIVLLIRVIVVYISKQSSDCIVTT